MSPAAHYSPAVCFQDGGSKQLHQASSYLLLSWRCRAPSPEWPSLRSSEPLGCGDGTSQVISRPCSRRLLVLFQGIGVKGRQSAALLCTSSVFTCLHRCMSRAPALMCEFLMHLFTIRVLGGLLKWAWVAFCRVKMDFVLLLDSFYICLHWCWNVTKPLNHIIGLINYNTVIYRCFTLTKIFNFW